MRRCAYCGEAATGYACRRCRDLAYLDPHRRGCQHIEMLNAAPRDSDNEKGATTVRTLPLTHDDLEEATSALDAIGNADEALRDLHERLKRKEDDGRSGRVRIAISRLGEAREIIAHAFR